MMTNDVYDNACSITGRKMNKYFIERIYVTIEVKD